MNRRTIYIQIALFLGTIVTTTLAGAEWIHGRSFLDFSSGMGWNEFLKGFEFTIPFLLFLTVHEFGHYFTARKWKINVTLPYYIPLWLGVITSIGTMGAFIRIKDKLNSRKKYFDIGVSGPLAGFFIAIGVLYYGFTHLPTLDFLFQIHPEYKIFGENYAKFVYSDEAGLMAVHLGDNIIFDFFKNTIADPKLLPHPNEITHYPLLFAGYLGLFFTALNLIPIGQLDGGHILFSLIGDKAFRIVSPILFYLFIFYAGLGLFSYEEMQQLNTSSNLMYLLKFAGYNYFIYLCFSRVTDNLLTNLILALSTVLGQLLLNYFFPNLTGYSGFIAFGFLLGRVIGIYHPPVEDDQPLDLGRQIIGWLTLLIFVGCFSLQPLW